MKTMFGFDSAISDGVSARLARIGKRRRGMLMRWVYLGRNNTAKKKPARQRRICGRRLTRYPTLVSFPQPTPLMIAKHVALALAFLSLSLAPLSRAVDYQEDIRPILNEKCFKCH